MIDLSKFRVTQDKACPCSYLLYNYGNGYQRLVFGRFRQKGYEPVEDKFLKSDDDFINPDEVHRISLSRTKRKIREIAICNNFEYFITLTVSSAKCDRYSLDECQDLMHKSFKEYARRCKKNQNTDFKYVVITESHIDGAYHFHGLFTCVLNDDLYLNKNGFYSSKFFDERLGFNSFSTINNLNACSFYITKYVTKNCVINSHNQIYFCSKGLKRAEVYELPLASGDEKYLDNFWNNDISNQFTKVRDFYFNDIDLNYQQWFLHKKDVEQERVDRFNEKKDIFLEKFFNIKKEF